MFKLPKALIKEDAGVLPGVDGQKMSRSVADDGTEVTIGNTVLKVRVVSEDV